ncbi:MAG: YbfB/YjiJ family MFS transporter [Candidatus Eremiobacteraeota bacterium]|nr:YbfB/YjiJ family MFS transporter [Candidatus Eremiobacteraeota bacterium]
MPRFLILGAFLSFMVNIGFSRFSYGVMLPALRAEFPASYAAFGLVNALNLAGYLVGTLSAPLFVRSERTRLLTVFLATCLVGAGMIGSAFVHDVTALAVWRTEIGLASGIAIVLTTVLTFDRVAPAVRGRASAAMWAGLAFGLAAAGPTQPFTLGAHPPFSWRALWIVMGVITPLVALLFAAAVRRGAPVPVPAPAAGSSGNAFAWSDLVAPRRFLFLNLSYGAFGAAYIAYATFAVALFRAHGLPSTSVGLAWGLVGIAGTIATFAIGPLLDGARARWSLGGTLALGGIGSALALLPSLGGTLTSAIVYGAGTMATPAIFTALIRRRTDARSYPLAYSAITGMLCTGQFIGPLLAGPLVDVYGLGAAAVFGTFAYALGTLAAFADAALAAEPAPARAARAA